MMFSRGSAQLATEWSDLSHGEIRALADHGVDLCRSGSWKKGFKLLSAVAESDYRAGELPSVFHSFLAYGIARYKGDFTQARSLATHAAEQRFFEPENFLNLARIEFLAGNRRKAHEICLKGLKLDPGQVELRRLMDRLGRRRHPALAFLPRRHAFNRALGKLTHRFR